ncbi:hypothetical protein DFJ73DRAFT_796978 [Zopfochytrium polystomum]|nr:hypothetical protein DFJ73DRAFT_796978 [Zopfochytrium polystomum]
MPSTASSQPAPPTTLTSLPTETLRAIALACAPSWRTLARLASTCQTLHVALLQSSTFLAEFLTHGVLTDPSHIESAKVAFADLASGWQDLPEWFDVIAPLDFLRFDAAVEVLRIAQRKRALPKLRSLRLLQTAAFLDRKDVVDWLMENRGLAVRGVVFADGEGPLAFKIACAYGHHELLPSLRSVAGEAFDDSAWELAAASGETKTLHALESLGLGFETTVARDHSNQWRNFRSARPPLLLPAVSRARSTPGLDACVTALCFGDLAAFEFLVDRQLRAGVLSKESLNSLVEMVSCAQRPDFFRLLTRLAPSCVDPSQSSSGAAGFVLAAAAECGLDEVCRAFLEKVIKERKETVVADGLDALLDNLDWDFQDDSGDAAQRDELDPCAELDKRTGILTSQFASPDCRYFHVVELGPAGVHIRSYGLIIVRTESSTDGQFEDMLRKGEESPVTVLGFAPRSLVVESPGFTVSNYADGAALLRAHGIHAEVDIYVADAEWAACGKLLALSAPGSGTRRWQRLAPSAAAQRACLAGGSSTFPIVYRTASIEFADSRRRWNTLKRLLCGPIDQCSSASLWCQSRPLYVNERNPLLQLEGLSVDAVRELHRNWVGAAGARFFAVVDDQALRTGRFIVGNVVMETEIVGRIRLAGGARAPIYPGVDQFGQVDCVLAGKRHRKISWERQYLKVSTKKHAVFKDHTTSNLLRRLELVPSEYFRPGIHKAGHAGKKILLIGASGGAGSWTVLLSKYLGLHATAEQ